MQWIRVCSILITSFGVSTSFAAELTLDQKLIVACFLVDEDAVVATLRRGANINGRFGDEAYNDSTFHDRWTGALTPLGAGDWTPLLALAAAREYPPPPEDLPEPWKNPAEARAALKKIPLPAIESRKTSAIVIAKILLSHGCKLDAEDGYGATAVYKAADLGKTSLVRLLLQAGANPNAVVGAYIDGPGRKTPLHVACRFPAIMQLLLDHGARPQAKDSEGRTPADWVNLDSQRKFDLQETAEGWGIRYRDPAYAPNDQTDPLRPKTKEE